MNRIGRFDKKKPHIGLDLTWPDLLLQFTWLRREINCPCGRIFRKLGGPDAESPCKSWCKWL